MQIQTVTPDIADSLGLTETGYRATPPIVQTELLRSPYGGTFEQTNPGVY